MIERPKTMLSRFARLAALALLPLLLLMADPAFAQPKGQKKGGDPNPPITVNNVREPRVNEMRSRKQVVQMANAAIARGKAVMKTERSNLKAVSKSEARNRQARLAAKSRLDAAKQAWRANKTPANMQAWQNAADAYMPIRQAHESALSMKRSQEARVQQLANFQRQAIGTANSARTAAPAQPRTGAPRFNRAARFVSPKSAYSVAPAPARIYDDVSAIRQAATHGGIYSNAGLNQQPQPLQQNAYAAPGSTLAF